MIDDESVWMLKINRCGNSDKIIHLSLHQTPESACKKSQSVMSCDVPELDEWYKQPYREQFDTRVVGYVIDDTYFPIRIEAEKKGVLECREPEPSKIKETLPLEDSK